MAETTTGDRPMPAVLALAELGELFSSGDGASHLIEDRPGWSAKLYDEPGDRAEADRLDELVALPAALPAEDVATLRRHTCWPVARITTPENPARGCVIPEIPEPLAPLRGGRATRAQRLGACRELVAVAEILERHHLVHPDWSEDTARWGQDTSVLVLDVDRCARGAVPNARRDGRDDPLAPAATDADNATDRFRVALLVARVLTGSTERAAVAHDLADSDGFGNRGLREILLDALLSTDREQRPSMAELSSVLAGEVYSGRDSFTARGPLPARTAAAATAPGTEAEPISVEYLD
ncbi:hypothetical protein REH65_08355 [Saccharopolyspora sp. ID03-671]|uniref:hypothetical protein n=1 Tax=Saccharopolyspora sp. ID03-671 TaxID=3073066 RepID=UPI003246F65F